ncbi:MAG: hypothetical protein RIM23_04830 [Coleofasciculus sp. G3-WIS-01]|uniref:GspE/PulE/PilB domain-containing protein n=1 Tax=Coleofasciculus sp. G3-WIS-01 TaxID=3069528 RepID=UPI0032F5144B
MLPSPQDPERADTPVQSPSSSQASELSGVSSEQMFRLIDSILPFEACLFHQFLPLSLEGKYLKLGMVDLHDSTALDYVRRILAFMNCSLKVEQITASTHKTMLSAYLHKAHQGTASKRQSSRRQQPIARSEQSTLIIDDVSLAEDEVNQPEPSTPSPPAADHKSNSTPVGSKPQPSDPARLTKDQTTNNQPPTGSQPPPSHDPSRTETEAVQPEASKAAAKTNHPPAKASQPTLIIDDIRQLQDELNQSYGFPSQKDSPPSAVTPQPTSQSPSDHSPVKPPPDSSKKVLAETALTPVYKRSLPTKALIPLEVKPLYLSRPIAFLATLAPHQIVEELLGRLLQGGMGRLYFQRLSERGRIVLRQDNSSQSVLDKLSLSVFEDIIVELKHLVNLPLQPITQPKQIESERFYQQESLLLCLRVVPGTHGEEATLQLLRGAALTFYQQQKVERLGQDAIKLAGQLQHKLNDIRDRSYRYSLPPMETLKTLNQLLHHLDKQLKTLTHNPMDQQDK